jgi:hypothetical protein
MSTLLAIILTVIGLHILEIGIFLFYKLIAKNKLLEQTAVQQSEYISALQISINAAGARLKEIDARGTFKSDDEIGWFFESVKEIQESLNEYTK